MEGGGTPHLGFCPRVHLPRGLSSASFTFDTRGGQSGLFAPNQHEGSSLPGSALLSEKPPVSPCLESCQTGYFKNMSVFTQHELIGLRCVCALMAGREDVPWASFPVLSSSVSIISGFRGSRPPYPSACPPRPVGLCVTAV